MLRISVAFVLLASSTLMAAIPRPAASQPTQFIEWKDTTPIPDGRGGHAAAVINDRVIVVGGTNWLDGKKEWHDQIWSRDDADGRWIETGKLPSGLALFGSSVQGDSLLIAGGWTQSGPTANAFRIRGGQMTAEPFAADLPAPRALMGAAAADGAFYVVGGLTDPVEFKTALSSVLRWNLKDDSAGWKSVAPLPRPLGLSATVSLGERLYVFGGRGPIDNSLSDSADGFCYDPKSDRWNSLAKLPGARRGAAAVAINDQAILIVGGCHGDEGSVVMLNEVLLYDVRNDSYKPCAALPFAALCEQAVMWRGKILIIGGEDKPRHRTSRVIIGTLTPR